MPVLEGPAIDPTLAGPAVVVVEAGDEITPGIPEWTPPDLTSEYDPTPARQGPRIELAVGRAVTREMVGFLQSAVVEDWSDDVELLAGYAATATASTSDPLWEELALSTTMSADGRKVYEWDPKGHMAWVYRDGQPVLPLIFATPQDIGGGRVALPMVGPQEQWSSRILGRAEQVDLLEGKGSFEDYDSQADMEADGWVFNGCTGTIVSDGVQGAKAIRLTGAGYLRSPRVQVEGADGYSRVVSGQVFGKWSDLVGVDAGVAIAKSQRTSFSAGVYDLAYSLEKAARRPDIGTQWTEQPLGFAARLEPGVATSWVWLELQSFGGGRNAYYDLAQLRLSIQTGFPPGTSTDLSYYVERIHRDSISRALGGYSDGLAIRMDALTGTEASMRWSHAARTPLNEVYRAVLEADGGPECRITAGWNLVVTDRLGSDRNDIAITQHDVIDPRWTVDPFSEIDDFIVDTGRGDGVSSLLAIVSKARNEERWRVAGFVTGPTDRTLNEIEAWAVAHARAAARIGVTASVKVPWKLADQITTGDSVPVTMHDGNLNVNRLMRVLRRQYLNDGSGLCSILLGPVDDGS